MYLSYNTYIYILTICKDLKEVVVQDIHLSLNLKYTSFFALSPVKDFAADKKSCVVLPFLVHWVE